MTTKFKRAKRPELVRTPALEALPEQAPSLIRPDQPSVARYLAMVGLILVAVGCSSLLAGRMNWPYLVRPWLGSLLLVPGLGLLLFHAANERDLQYRRVYGLLGLALLALGVAFRLIPYPEGRIGGMFFPMGIACLLVGLFFVLAFVRVETDEVWRFASLRVLGGLGFLLGVVGLVSGILVGLVSDRLRETVVQPFFFADGLLMAVLALAFLGAYVAASGAGSEAGFRVGLGIGLLGLITVLVSLARSFLPYFAYRFGWIQTAPAPYFVPAGLLLLGVGLLYLLVAFGICSDLRLVVLTRRELSAFFYSPVAYLVLLGMTLVAFYEYWRFVEILALTSAPRFGGGPLEEPIVRYMFYSLIPVICLIFAVPLVTMRLLSEEKRTGTLEVLLTAPVNEGVVVWSKFLAAFIFFLLLWVPYGLFLLALRAGTGEPFEYQPLLGFAIVLVCTGAGFVSMGLFFSALTGNQIIAAVLTFVGMIAHTAPHLIGGTPDIPSNWQEILSYVSYLDLWRNTLSGTFAPRLLLFHISAAAFFLFLTAKVLEARKWS
jgi:ABC-type transport system involved in multi-copper enzyme maturation permease subunit